MKLFALYEIVGGERMIITIASAPIRSGNRIIGAIGIDLELSEVNSMVEASSPLEKKEMIS